MIDKYPYTYRIANICIICGNKSATGKRISCYKSFICAECLLGHCANCGVELTKAVRNANLTPMTSGHLAVCVICYKKDLMRQMELELRKLYQAAERIKNNYTFRITHQFCSCGRFNDSRDEKNFVKYRFCQRCRQLYGDQQAMKRFRPQNRDKRKVIFDPIAGYKDGK